MEIIVQSLPNLRSVTFALATRHGTSHDETAGLTYVMVPSMLRGSENHSEEEINRLVIGRGGHFINMIEKDFSLLGIRTVPDAAEKSMDLLFDMISRPLLKESIIEIEKKNLLQKVAQVQANPLQNLIFFETDKTIFGEEHPLALSPTGNPDTVMSITRDMIQDQMLTELLVNPVGIILGNFDDNIAEKYRSRFINGFEKMGIEIKTKNELFPEVNVPSWKIDHIEQKDADNAYLSLNCRIPRDKKLPLMIEFVATLIGGTVGSRMFKLRDEKGLSYISMSEFRMLGEFGVIRCLMDLKPDRFNEGLSSLHDIVVDLSEKIVEENEHETTLSYLTGNLDMNFDKPTSLIKRLVIEYYHGENRSFSEIYQAFNRISREDILDFCEKIMKPDNMSLTVGGKFEVEQAKESWASLCKEEH